MTPNDEEKLNSVRQISDMFNVSHEHARGLCNQHNWNVQQCIDFLITNKGSHQMPVETAPAVTNADPAQNLRWFTQKYQNQSGAIPKNSNSPAATTPSTSSSIRKRIPFTQTSAAPKKYNNNIDSISSAKNDPYKNIKDQIQAGYRIMIMMRGAPGCGKSCLAESLVRASVPLSDQYQIRDFILSSDDYFYDAVGRYYYMVDRLSDAHTWNQKRTRDKARAGLSPIIVDNTNMQLWEMMPYVQAGVQHGYIIEFCEPNTPWRCSAGKLANKNQHRVTRDKIQRMLDKYEKGTVSDVIKMLKETKYTVSLPQMRTYPPFESLRQEVVEETDEKFKIFQTDTQTSVTDIETTITVKQEPEFESTWGTYDESDAPKKQRSDSKNISKVEKPQAWKPYEEEAPLYWGSTKPILNQPEKKAEKSILDLLKENEGVQLEKLTTAKKVCNEQETQTTNKSFLRHSINCSNEDQSFVALRQIYPNKETASLWDLFVKCKGDIDWAVDILLKEDELAMNNEFYEPHVGGDDDDFLCGCDSMLKTTLVEPNEEMSTTSAATANATIAAPNIKPQRQRQRTARSAVPNQQLQFVKQAIENCFVLGDEQYSEHTRKIRDIRNGILDGPSTQIFDENVEVQTPATPLINEKDDNDDDESDYSELCEMELGEQLVNQLCTIFKAESTLGEKLPEKLSTNVFIPRTLAKQLYMLWIEAVYNQMEEQRQHTLREDEQFARLLKHPKYSECQQSPSNVRELLDMELAWSIYDNEKQALERESESKPTDIATHLTKMKLCEIFPDIPRETLLDILTAHDNNYSKTVEVLQSNSQRNSDVVGTLTQDELLGRAIRENELLTRQAQQLEKQTSVVYSDSSSGGANAAGRSMKTSSLVPEETKRLALRDFEETRNMAAHHCQLKAECYQKAKEAIQKGNSGVAVYYSQIANLHKKKIDMYNHRAANCIMEVHKYTQNNPDLLDLHYLHVLEAIGCLDLFLDRHITVLRTASRSYKHVFIITGRGLHSAGGVSTIKNKVKSRLKERNLRWSEVNPGLLKVKIFSASRHSKNI